MTEAFIARRRGWRWEVVQLCEDGIARPCGGRLRFWRWITAAAVAQELQHVHHSTRWQLMSQIDAEADSYMSDGENGEPSEMEWHIVRFLDHVRAELDLGSSHPAGSARQVTTRPGMKFVSALGPAEFLCTAPDWPPAIVNLETLTVRRIDL